MYNVTYVHTQVILLPEDLGLIFNKKFCIQSVGYTAFASRGVLCTSTAFLYLFCTCRLLSCVLSTNDHAVLYQRTARASVGLACSLVMATEDVVVMKLVYVDHLKSYRLLPTTFC